MFNQSFFVYLLCDTNFFYRCFRKVSIPKDTFLINQFLHNCKHRPYVLVSKAFFRDQLSDVEDSTEGTTISVIFSFIQTAACINKQQLPCPSALMIVKNHVSLLDISQSKECDLRNSVYERNGRRPLVDSSSLSVSSWRDLIQLSKSSKQDLQTRTLLSILSTIVKR